MRRLPGGLLVALVTGLLALAGCETARPSLTGPDVPFVATPGAVAEHMLRFAGTTREDVVYDLGSGDGRLVVAAARAGARAVGVEIDPRLVQESIESALRAGVAERTRFLWQDLFQTELREATVVTVYLTEAVNLRLRPKLLRELRPGARIVSHDFGMGDWTPDAVARLRGPDREHTLYRWVVPADVAGTWRGSLTLPDGTRILALDLEQRFQRVTARVSLDRRPAEVAKTTVSGDALALETVAGVPALSLRGRVDGDWLRGDVTVRDAGQTRVVPWVGRRSG